MSQKNAGQTHNLLITNKSFENVAREEHRLKVFENRVLRRIFGPRRKELVCFMKYY
jgi:hypothetical protein